MNEQNTRTSYPTDLRDWQQRRRQHLFILPLPLPQRGRGRGLGGRWGPPGVPGSTGPATVATL